MANFNGNFNPVYNYPLPPEFMRCALDLDLGEDEEFRAGYPFSNIPKMELNEDYEPHNGAPSSDNNVVQSSNSGDGICISTAEKKNDQSTELSMKQQEQQVDDRLESSSMDERHKSHEIHSGKSNGYDKEDHGDEHQYNSKDQVNIINVGTFEQSSHVQTNN